MALQEMTIPLEPFKSGLHHPTNPYYEHQKGNNMPEKELTCNECCEIVERMKGCCDEIKTVGKIDWSRLLALVMQLLPLILGFFAQKDDQPESK
jgi:hypothetical protein